MSYWYPIVAPDTTDVLTLRILADTASSRAVTRRLALLVQAYALLVRVVTGSQAAKARRSGHSLNARVTSNDLLRCQAFHVNVARHVLQSAAVVPTPGR